MKKFITLLLVLTGMVCTVSATTRIFIQPDYWAAASAKLKVNLFNGDTFKSYTILGDGDLYKTGIYFLDIDETQINKFQLCRLNPSDLSDQWNYSGNISISGSAYYMMGDVSNGKTDVTVSSYLPCNYYFTSSKDSWASATKMSEATAGTFTHTFNASDYAGYNFVWAPGDAFTKAGAMSVWTKAIRPKNTTDEYPGYKVNHWTTFQKLVYDDESTMQIFDGTDAGDANLWHVPTSHESSIVYLAEGTIDISFVKASNYATISPQKKVTITSAGWATYSNSENYKVTGAKAYIVTAAGSTATLTALDDEAEIPGGTGILLKGDADDYVVTPSAGTATISGNLLMGSNNYTFNITGEYYGTNYDGYVLGGSGATLGFYPVNPSSNTLGIHKAFLKIDKVPGSRSFDFIGFGEEGTTGIQQTTVNIQNTNEFFNLAGQRVANPSKGLYIVNGKKVIIK